MARAAAAGASLLLLLLALALGGACAGAAAPPSPLPCSCTDVDARTSFISTVNFTCWEQALFGKCTEGFMLDSIKEVPEGYCQISCGRCACCPSLATAATSAGGLNEFLWAMNRAADRVPPLSTPGLAATLMAPEDGAMRELFARLGGKERIDADAGVRGKLADIMAYHVVQPLPGYEAWTSPFFADGTRLETARNGSGLTVSRGSGGAVKVQGSGSSAEIVQADMYACKGYINKLNWYLLPPGVTLE